MEVSFKVDSQLKNDFLGSKPTATAKSNTFILTLVDEFESMAEKSVYNFSISELREMMAMQFKNSSIGTIVKNISIIRTYIDFAIDKGFVRHMENRLATFTRKEAKAFVSKQAIEYRYISPEDLKSYQSILDNEQDKLLLELPYIGVRGRTVEEGTLEEIISLQIDLKSENTKNCILELVKNNGEKRELKVSEETMQLVIDTYKQEFYVGNNGVESTVMRGKLRKKPINHVGKHVLRVPGSKKHELFNPVLVNSRFNRIQKWVSNEYLTVHTLYMSGMITRAKQILAEKGELVFEDYVSICADYDYGSGDPTKYALTLKDTVEQYL